MGTSQLQMREAWQLTGKHACCLSCIPGPVSSACCPSQQGLLSDRHFASAARRKTNMVEQSQVCAVPSASITSHQNALTTMALLPADTGELSEVQLEYAAPQELALSKEQLPDSGWPQPSWPRWPFNGGLVDHCRLVAPGVIVGKGWKGSGRGRHGQEFLKFMMVKRPAQTQPQSDKSALE